MKLNEILDATKKINEQVTIIGWVQNIRNHGNVMFLDIRDRSALIQAVGFSKDITQQIAKEKIGTEDLVEIEGLVKERPDNMKNSKLQTGDIEFEIKSIQVISKSEVIPFEIDKDTSGVNENVRLKYRYLDLRSERMKINLKTRHKVNLFFRNYLSKLGFWEIETPSLTKGTPEGSREFLVPSRLHQNKFYVLPQSPQQFKQLLMVGGIEKYFQIVRCFRDEDQRGDRQPEFTQLDLEASFKDENDIMKIIEEAIVELIKDVFPHLKIVQKPFPVITYRNSMDKYKNDKPDLRKNKESDQMAFCWVVDFPLFEHSASEGKIVSCHHPFTRPKTEDMNKLEEKPLEVKAIAYDLILNGVEIGGGSLRIHEKDLQEKIFKILGLKEKDISERFGHLLEAFKYSPPPHGGIALGLDRLISLLLNEENIREVIAFPKTGDAKDLLFNAPSEVSELSLKELYIKNI